MMAAVAAHAAPQLAENLRISLQSRVDSGELASVVVGVIEGADSAVYGFGKAGERMPDAQSVYEIGSITKTFTGVLLGQAVKSGTARLDQPVAQLLPAYQVPEFKGTPITLLDLATQTSGLPRMPDNIRPARADNPYADYTAVELKAFLAKHQMARQPGTLYEYSNLGTGLLGHALSELAKKSYGDLIRDQIAVPLGMNSTSVALSPSMRARLMPGHSALGQPVANWDMAVLAGAGALRSNAQDMVRYVQAMMSAGPDSAYALARQVQRPTDGKKGGQIGLFWHISTVRGTPVVWHNGMTGGYASFAGFTGDGMRGVVVLTSSAVSLDNVAMASLVPGAKEEPKQLVLAPELLAEYAGRYLLQPGVILTVKLAPFGLTMQVAGQNKVPAYASARDEFFARANDSRFSFKRASSGGVESVEGQQNGRVVSAKKLGPRMPIVLDAATLEHYRGNYMLSVGGALAITVDGGQLYAQAMGQAPFPLSATQKDEFYYEAADIEISFKRNADGKVRQLVLRQEGRDVKGELLTTN